MNVSSVIGWGVLWAFAVIGLICTIAIILGAV